MKHVFGLIAVLAILLPVQAFAQATTTQPAATTTQPAAAPEQTGTVVRALFTSGIAKREPVDTIKDTSDVEQKVFFFTEFKGMEGQTLVHRWSYLGEVRAEVSFKVRAWRWRVYSSKIMIAEWTSDWTVDVVDGNGTVLVTKTLTNSGG
jgi:hypothetical protein